MNTTKKSNTWTFATTSATVNGHTFPASYSLARNGDVYVFTALRAADGTDMPVRIHVTADMPMHADAVAAAKAARDASAQATPAQTAPTQPAPTQPAPTQDAPAQEAPKAPKAPKASKATKASKPAPVQAAPVQPAPAQEAPKAPKAPKASKTTKASKPAPVQPAPVQPAPVQPAPVQEAPVQPAAANGKAWIGTKIQGKGWSIAFDADAGRTRVQVDGAPTDAQRTAIEQAGFFWSAQMQSWNKKLTCKAYRAACELASALNALA